MENHNSTILQSCEGSMGNLYQSLSFNFLIRKSTHSQRIFRYWQSGKKI